MQDRSAIHLPSVVLNRSWQPINITRVAKTIGMLARGVAHAMDPKTYELYDWDEWLDREPGHDEPWIQAIARRVCAPRYVVLNSFNKTPDSMVKFSRRNVFKRDRHTCQYCGVQPRHGEFTMDHVLPRAQGGISTWENCVLACEPCNGKKADRTPEQAGMKLRKQPRRPAWDAQYSNYAGDQAERDRLLAFM